MLSRETRGGIAGNLVPRWFLQNWWMDFTSYWFCFGFSFAFQYPNAQMKSQLIAQTGRRKL